MAPSARALGRSVHVKRRDRARQLGRTRELGVVLELDVHLEREHGEKGGEGVEEPPGP